MHDIRHSRFWKLIGFFTRTDLDVLAESNRFDRLTVVWTSIALLLAFVLHTTLWSSVAALLVPSAALSLLAGAMIATLICTLEAAMAASDWSLAGVLRQPGVDRERALRVGGRILVALILSYATSLAFGLWLHGPELLYRQEAERRAANAPLVEEAQREKARLHGELVQPVERALAQAEAERAALRVAAEQAARDQRSAAANADTAALDAQREENGLERLKGRGPRYADALMRAQLAQAEAASARQRELQARQELGKRERQVETLRADLKRVSGEFEAKSRALDGRLQHDDRYQGRRDSLLSRYLALRKLYGDAEVGEAASHLHLVIQVTLICLELILLMVKTVFAPASVYLVRLTARTRLEAAEIDRELGRQLAELHGKAAELHVVAAQPPAAEGVQDDEAEPRQRA